MLKELDSTREFVVRNWLLVVVFAAVVLHAPALFTFFSGDDWFHLRVVQISRFSEFLNFFNPVPNPQSTAFYRPIPNQLFFFTFFQFFGMQVLFYHLFVFGLFALSIILFERLLLRLSFSLQSRILAVIIFAFSHTQFTRLYFLSAAQELFLSVFGLGTVLLSLSKRRIINTVAMGGAYALALLSKDSAIMIPVAVVLVDWYCHRKVSWSKVGVLVGISLLYLIVRVFVFGFASTVAAHETYHFSFSPIQTLNTLYMYLTWAVGGAELLQDYLQSPVSLIDRFFTDFGQLGAIMISLLITNWTLLGILVSRNFRQIRLQTVVTAALFVVLLLPVLFLPQHKFAIQMSLPLMSFAAALGMLLKQERPAVVGVFLAAFLSLNLSSIYLTFQTHYSVQRARISQRAYDYFSSRHPELPAGSTVVIANAPTEGSHLQTWGSSKQVSHALMGDNFFRVLYPGAGLVVMYEDLTTNQQTQGEELVVSAAALLEDD